MSLDIYTLIDYAISDGHISSTERSVLETKAMEAGISVEELNLIINAKLQVYAASMEPVKEVKQKVLKCPSCNDQIDALNRVCPSCDYVLNQVHAQESGSELEKLISSIEDVLIQLKASPAKSFLKSIGNNLYISGLLIFSLGLSMKSLLIDSKMPAIFVLGGLIMLLIYGPKKVLGMIRNKTLSRGSGLDEQKAIMKKHTRTATTLYGDNQRVSDLLQQFENEIHEISKSHKLALYIERGWYGFLLLLIVICRVL